MIFLVSPSTHPVTPGDNARTGKQVGLIGAGAVGAPVAERLLAGDIPGASLAGVLALDPVDPALPRVADLDELIDRCEVIVEAAGAGGLRAYAPQILASGRRLVVLSVGALLDPQLWELTRNAALGQVLTTSGAIGGLDLLAATAAADPQVRVALRTTKKPTSLIQQWMSVEEADRLRGLTPADPAVVVFTGRSLEAAKLFPANLNVAAALALAAGSPDRVSVTLRADAAAPVTEHRIETTSSLGSMSLTVHNSPLPENPATSSVVPWALLQTIAQSMH